MIPIHEIRTKEWYEFEGASTYEYAHAEVKPSTKYVINKKLKKTTCHIDLDLILNQIYIIF